MIPLLFGLPLVFWPLHIAFLELVIDPMCSIVFDTEAEEADEPPATRARANALWVSAYRLGASTGCTDAALVASLFALALRQGLQEADARALTFTTLVAANLGFVLVNRSKGASLWAAFRRRNPAVWSATASTVAMLTLAVAAPSARELFHFGPLHPDDIAVARGCGVAILLLLEGLKQGLGGLKGNPARTQQYRVGSWRLASHASRVGFAAGNLTG